MTTLICCSHGTDNLAGRFAIRRLADAVRAARPGLDVRESFVDVQHPQIAEVVDGVVAEGGDAVVVPVLLSTGYHIRVDIGRAVRAHPGRAVAAGALGPDERLALMLVERLVQSGARPDDAVVLAAAGSSSPGAAVDVEAMAEALRREWDGAITVGYCSSAQPTVAEAVAEARTAGAERVAVASYLLAPGFFHDRLASAGADLVTTPLAPDPRLADLVLDRFDAAAAQLAEQRKAA